MIYSFKVFLLLLSSTLSIRAISDADLCKLEPEFDIYQRFSVDKERLLVVKRHPTDCSKFYICQTEDYPLILSCPAGLYYDEYYGLCDFPENVDCPSTFSTEPSSTESSTETSATTESPSTSSTTSEPFDPKAIHLHSEEIEAKYFHLRYSCAHDRYDRLLLKPDGSEELIENVENWFLLSQNWSNIQRHIENDWNTVYLARRGKFVFEDSLFPGWVTWNFDFPLTIKDIYLSFWTATYYGAEVSLYFEDRNGGKFNNIESMIGKSKLSIIAELNGGFGSEAWKHLQLFQQMMGTEDFPFELKISFE